LIIAIDGPAGSGKSTVAKEVAKRLGLLYVDTGAMYRALTLKAIEEGLDLKNESVLIDLARRTRIEFGTDSESELFVLLDGRIVTEEIRRSEVTNAVKYIARIPDVRKEMVRLQREIISCGDAVLEGRDIGTVVCPNADKKFYLDARLNERVKRRFRELKQKGYDVVLEDVKRDVEIRDYTDKNRDVGPLKIAKDAVVIDTTDLSIEEVADLILKEADALKR